jgi:hypothetical protein
MTDLPGVSGEVFIGVERILGDNKLEATIEKISTIQMAAGRTL